jgi:sporulation related protein/FecR-like protein
MRIRFGVCALLALFAAPAIAQALTVEGVVSPAWVERGGARLPLAVGMRLNDKDRVVTGAGSRLLLRMAEGSAVKLGENATVALDGLADRKDADSKRLVTAALDVVRGAFRFTTGIFDKRPAGRNVDIRVATITTGIRGTDLWGKSDEKRDLVCLIEGKISVAQPQAGEFTMSEPLSFFVAPRGAQPLPVAPVDSKQLALWAAETEIETGSGGARRGGRVHVDAAVSADQAAALAAYDRLRAAGYPAVMRPVKTADRVDYRVRVQNFPTRQDAAAAVEKLKALGLTGAAVSK